MAGCSGNAGWLPDGDGATMRKAKITSVWITTSRTDNEVGYVAVVIHRRNQLGGTNRSYNCHSGNDKERRARFLERGRKMQLAYFEQGV